MGAMYTLCTPYISCNEIFLAVQSLQLWTNYNLPVPANIILLAVVTTLSK